MSLMASQNCFSVLLSPFREQPSLRGFVCLFTCLSLPIVGSGLESFTTLCPGYIGGNKETQGAQHCVIPQVPRSLGSPHSSFYLSESYTCLLCYIQEIFSCRRDNLGEMG